MVRSGFRSEGLQLCHPFIEPRTLRADDLEANFCGDVDAVDNLLVIRHQFKYSLTRGTVAPFVNVLGRVETSADSPKSIDARACRIGSPCKRIYVRKQEALILMSLDVGEYQRLIPRSVNPAGDFFPYVLFQLLYGLGSFALKAVEVHERVT